MKCLLVAALFACVPAITVTAAEIKVQAVMAEDKDSEPTDVFGPDSAELFAFFTSEGTKKGDKFRAVWTAEDVGDAADANTKIDEATLTADQDNFRGSFSLTKPTDGWPEGKYRVDIYVGDKLATTAKFTIEAETESGEDEQKSSDE